MRALRHQHQYIGKNKFDEALHIKSRRKSMSIDFAVGIERCRSPFFKINFFSSTNDCFLGSD